MTRTTAEHGALCGIYMTWVTLKSPESEERSEQVDENVEYELQKGEQKFRAS